MKKVETNIYNKPIYIPKSNYRCGRCFKEHKESHIVIEHDPDGSTYNLGVCKECLDSQLSLELKEWREDKARIDANEEVMFEGGQNGDRDDTTRTIRSYLNG